MNSQRSVVWPGRGYPLGATWDDQGVNFAQFSEHGERVDPCLFKVQARREIERITLRERPDRVWHFYLPDTTAGLLYEYRVHGPYRPQLGQRFNPNNLLLDPHARSAFGKLHGSTADFAYKFGANREDPSFDWQTTVRPCQSDK